MDVKNKEFASWKNATLSKADLSRKSSIDAPIRDLISLINADEGYCSTSSCSGRIILLSDETGDTKKRGCVWHLVSHEKVSTRDVISSLEGAESCSKLKFEAFILHVRCRSLNEAVVMQQTSLSSGFKNSGLVIGGKDNRNITMAVRGTLCLEAPLTSSGGNRITSDDYVEFLVNLANEKMSENEIRIKLFEENIRKMFERKSVSAKKKITGRENYLNNIELHNKSNKENKCEPGLEVFDDVCNLFDS